MQELFGRYKERILLKNATDDNQWMRPHDIDYRVSSKFRKMVGADDGVTMATPHIIDTGFELNEIVDVGSTFSGPVHPANNATERKSILGVAAGQLLKHLQHPILIETAVPKVCFGVGPKLEW
jgi:hypothetical protein